MSKSKLNADWFGRREASYMLRAHFDVPRLPHYIYQRLGPLAREMVGTGGAQRHMRECIRRADGRGLIAWDVRSDDILLAARSLTYMQHNDGDGGYERYLGALGLEPPLPVEVQLPLLQD